MKLADKVSKPRHKADLIVRNSVTRRLHEYTSRLQWQMSADDEWDEMA